MKFLIINADDFGMSHEFNVAIADLLHNGCISTTSLMPNGLAYDEALSLIDSLALDNIGVHLTLTRDAFVVEHPLVYKSLTSGPTLQDTDGKLFTKPATLAAKANGKELKAEVAEQLKNVMLGGVDFTHIDNHMYSLMPRMGLKGYSAVLMAYASLRIKEHKGIRIASSFYDSQPMNYIWSGRLLRPLLSAWMRKLRLFGPQYSFAFPYYVSENVTVGKKKEWLDRFFSNLKSGLTELHIHPCIYSEALKSYNPYWKNRVDEYNIFKEINADWLRNKYGIVLTSYKQYHEEYRK